MDLTVVTALFLFVAVVLAIGILAVVALPHLRGEDEGSRAVARVRTDTSERHHSRTAAR